MLKENALQQKSRVEWIQLGDGNNKYFSSVIKEGTQRNSIHEIIALTGGKLTHPKAINAEIIQFYKGLMVTSTRSLPEQGDYASRNPLKSLTNL